MDKPTPDSRSLASRRHFLKGGATVSALALARPVSAIPGGLPGAIPEDGSSALPPAFAALKPLGARIHPIAADEFYGRLQRAQKPLAEPAPKFDALFFAPRSEERRVGKECRYR